MADETTRAGAPSDAPADDPNEWTAVYTRAGGGEPVALFRDSRHTIPFRRLPLEDVDFDGAITATVKLKVAANKDVAAVFADLDASAVEAAPGNSPDDALKGEIRAEKELAERKERLGKEVEHEMAEEKKNATKAGVGSG